MILSVVIAVFGALVPLVVLPFLDDNLYAQIGMVMPIGLASKNAILIVEFARVRRDAGVPVAEAAVEAAWLCFRAVVMTALSVLPLVFASGAGAASRTSIGFVVFGGMVVAATVVGVVFVPVPYYVVERAVGRRGDGWGGADGGRSGLMASRRRWMRVERDGRFTLQQAIHDDWNRKTMPCYHATERLIWSGRHPLLMSSRHSFVDMGAVGNGHVERAGIASRIVSGFPNLKTMPPST